MLLYLRGIVENTFTTSKENSKIPGLNLGFVYHKLKGGGTQKVGGYKMCAVL